MFVSVLVFSVNSAYLCVLCVNYIGADDLTQSAQSKVRRVRREVQ
jgi:hypothetical protein